MAKKSFSIAMRYAMVLLFNPSEVVHDEEEKKGTKMHRENTPWYIIFPDLQVSIVARDPFTNEPIMGYIDTDEALALASAIYTRLTTDEDSLKQARATYEYPADIQQYGKVMPRMMRVPV